MNRSNIQKLSKSFIILIIISFLLISSLPLPSMAHSITQITPENTQPSSYGVLVGTPVPPGDLTSVYWNDGVTLDIEGKIVQTNPFYYEHRIELYFDFIPIKCDELYFDFTPLNTIMPIKEFRMYYTDGSYDNIGILWAGFHTIALRDWKYLARIQIIFFESTFLIPGEKRYICIDLCVARTVGDYSPPIIDIEYQDGDETDGNPGKWNVFAYDDESGINEDTINVLIDGEFVGDVFGEYNVPNTLEDHTIYVEVENNDGFLGSNSDSIVIIDDDVLLPEINYIYTGDGTDGNPGEIIITAYDESGLSVDPTGNYAVPNTLGTHNFLFNATDSDNDRLDDALTRSIPVSITIADDDDTPPEINYVYTGDGTDGNPGEIIITAYDESGLSVDPTGNYAVPNDLGTHNFEFTAIDNDNDRPDDALTRTIPVSITIDDDDDTPPEISIQYFGSGFDNDPGYFEWNIFDLDSGISEINITITYESTEGIDDYVITLLGTEIGSWSLPPNLGIYIIEISARDNDDDRTLIVDSLTTELTRVQEIIDDDINIPELSNLIIIPDIFEINVTFNAIDESGLDDISTSINGQVVEPFLQVKDGNTYSFIFENQWLFKSGTSEVFIQVKDGDNDRPNDALTSSIAGTFENVLFQMYEYVIWQLKELKNYIEENLCPCVKLSLNKKLTTAQGFLYEAFNYIENGDVKCGLFHDYRAILFIGFAEHKTNIFNKFGRIHNTDAEYIIDTCHEIRNNIVILKGISVGLELSHDISLIEVELLNLRDFINDETQCCVRRFLYNMISYSSGFLELALFKISMGHDIECILKHTQWKLEKTISKIEFFLEKGKISEDIANYLIERISNLIENIEQIKKVYF